VSLPRLLINSSMNPIIPLFFITHVDNVDIIYIYNILHVLTCTNVNLAWRNPQAESQERNLRGVFALRGLGLFGGEESKGGAEDCEASRLRYSKAHGQRLEHQSQTHFKSDDVTGFSNVGLNHLKLGPWNIDKDSALKSHTCRTLHLPYSISFYTVLI
jgi:hypothetical protein